MDRRQFFMTPFKWYDWKMEFNGTWYYLRHNQFFDAVDIGVKDMHPESIMLKPPHLGGKWVRRA